MCVTENGKFTMKSSKLPEELFDKDSDKGNNSSSCFLCRSGSSSWSGSKSCEEILFTFSQFHALQQTVQVESLMLVLGTTVTDLKEMFTQAGVLGWRSLCDF